jgi:hypothetical protein
MKQEDDEKLDQLLQRAHQANNAVKKAQERYAKAREDVLDYAALREWKHMRSATWVAIVISKPYRRARVEVVIDVLKREGRSELIDEIVESLEATTLTIRMRQDKLDQYDG